MARFGLFHKQPRSGSPASGDSFGVRRSTYFEIEPPASDPRRKAMSRIITSSAVGGPIEDPRAYAAWEQAAQQGTMNGSRPAGAYDAPPYGQPSGNAHKTATSDDLLGEYSPTTREDDGGTDFIYQQMQAQQGSADKTDTPETHTAADETPPQRQNAFANFDDSDPDTEATQVLHLPPDLETTQVIEAVPFDADATEVIPLKDDLDATQVITRPQSSGFGDFGPGHMAQR